MADRRLHAVGFGLLLLVTSACGSTVQLNGGTAQVGGGTSGGDGLGGSTTGTQQGTTGGLTGGTTGSVLAGGTGGGLGGGTTGGSTTGGATGGFGSTGSTGPSGNAPGVTATKVYVGFIYDKNAGSVNKAVGVGSITSGDSKANNDAIIKDINAHGGVGGRQIVPIYAQFDSESAQTLDQQYSAVCQTFTVDNHVFAETEAGTDNFKQCLSKAGVLMLSSDLPTEGARELRQWPGLIEQGYPNVDRLASYFLKPLVDQKYFTPWDTVNGQPAAAGAVKVGILTYDDPVFRRAVDTILVPGLQRLGYTPVVERIARLTRAADAGPQAAAIKSAQLTFAANGVTHIIMFETNGNLSTFFLPTARSQKYYPRYGVNTASAPEALIESGALDPAQYRGAVGYGWIPTLDLPVALDKPDGPYSNANRRYCLAVMKRAGITFDSGNAEGIALNSCSSLYLLKTVLDKRPPTVTLPWTVNAIESLGTSYQRAGALGEDFEPGRQDPVNTGYYYKYFEDCKCMHYYGSPVRIP